MKRLYNHKSWWLALVLSAVGPYCLSAQMLRGYVNDAESGQPLVGATVEITELGRGQATDAGGIFRFSATPPGRYRLRIAYLGYESLEIPEVLVLSGKETVLDIALNPAGAELAPVTVRAVRTPHRALAPSVYTLSPEENLRFPAAFSDPGRLALLLPGVVGADDQTNALAVRGHSPNDLSWRLEGIEIVNPNHTSNAGGITDLPTFNGGGVTALSAQLLDQSLFYTSAFPTGYGNAAGAIMDLRLRPGNNEKREYTAQAGFIGLDLATEGPLRQGGRSSYLVNYRYSFTGLLSNLGVPFGDEDIRFQDLSFHLVFPLTQGGRLSFFGLGGQSSNAFSPPADSAEWESEKYLYRAIDFDSRMGVLGFAFQRPAGASGLWRLAGGWSGQRARRQGFHLDPTPYAEERDQLQETKMSLRAVYQHRLRSGWTGELGAEWLRHAASLWAYRGLGLTPPDLATALPHQQIVQPFVAVRGQWQRWQTELGVHGALYVQPTRTVSLLEPRAALHRRLGLRHRLSLTAGLHSQVAGQGWATELEPGRWAHLNLGWRTQLGPSLTLELQAYAQQGWRLPVDPLRQVSFGSEWDGQRRIFPETSAAALQYNWAPTTAGAARHHGWEVSLRNFAGDEGWYYAFSATQFFAGYQIDPEAEGNTFRLARFSTNYAGALVVGREWGGESAADGQRRSLGVNVGLRANGGLPTAAVDAEVSRALFTTHYQREQGYDASRASPYWRADLRVYFLRNRPGASSTLSLDIQNVTNRSNVAYPYYDRLLGEVTTRYQLEFIPVISYRLNW